MRLDRLIPVLLTLSIEQSACPANDQTCLCLDDGFIKNIEGCVLTSCPLKYALITQNITWTACDFPLHTHDYGTRIFRIILFIVLPTLSIVLRTVTKFARLSTWGWDDYTVFVAYVSENHLFWEASRTLNNGQRLSWCHTFLCTCFVSLRLHGVEHNGAGMDLWTLTTEQITNYFKAFYALQTLYHACIDVIKASILFMYLRIFHLPDEKIRITLWITQGVNLLSGLLFIFIGLFQCRPVSLAWTFWTGEATGKCIDIAQLGLAHACINIGLDVWILILPATQIWNMNLAMRKKLAIMFMFSLGLFLTVVSIIRVKYILDFKKQPLNPTVAMMPAVLWSDIELNVGIFTACIPNLRQFFVRFILGRSERKKSLSLAVAGDKGFNSHSMPKTPTFTQQLSELDTVDMGQSQDGSASPVNKTPQA
ncbi:hypothetical protein CCHL11_02519 [Colletotrichum chlorophyti]|uniref:Uncharacterized protein n=1 Tax=Colletotrichum chlorophyti TaxID=708187 RepID=A0A1Q8S8U4_9PEZI|nr:hypothetical protein CCHL11_02519 [Colletotrichum chlorophyti]